MLESDITLDMWEKYEQVRESGAFNMLSSDAIAMSGLDKDAYICIIENYDELRTRFEDAS